MTAALPTRRHRAGDADAPSHRDRARDAARARAARTVLVAAALLALLLGLARVYLWWVGSFS